MGESRTPDTLVGTYTGEEGGAAIADVILGDYCPAGRLPYTVYPSVHVIPPQTEYDVTKGFTYLVFQGEGCLSLWPWPERQQFRYSNLRLKPQRLRPDGSVEILVRVQNTGKRAGDEVAQLYIHQKISKGENDRSRSFAASSRC